MTNPTPTTIIREALRYSLFLGIHSDLPWFTQLNQKALLALETVEGGHVCDCKGNGGTIAPATPGAALTASCAWPPPADGEACSS